MWIICFTDDEIQVHEDSSYLAKVLELGGLHGHCGGGGGGFYPDHQWELSVDT